MLMLLGSKRRFVGKIMSTIMIKSRN